jgi:hypothetical protein
LLDFLHNFYNYDVTGGKLVSERVVEDNWNVAVGASSICTLTCVDAWVEDFRNDTPRNTVPTMIIHGDADRILPTDATSRRQAKMDERDLKGRILDGQPQTWTDWCFGSAARHVEESSSSGPFHTSVHLLLSAILAVPNETDSSSRWHHLPPGDAWRPINTFNARRIPA